MSQQEATTEAIIGNLKKDAKKNRRAARAAAAGREPAEPKPKHPKAPLSFRRNVLPPFVGILVMLGVLFAINGQWLIAQWQYQRSKPLTSSTSVTPAAAVIADDTKSPDPSAGPQVVIPAINVQAPMIYEPGTEEWQMQLALRNGVVRFATSAEPGQPGNVILLGHSSGQPWAPGNYKFVFTLADKLKPGDAIQIDQDGTRYTYEVTGSQIVMPDQVSVLNQTTEPTLTLVSCYPVGSNAQRLIVNAKLVRPLPSAANVGIAASDAPAPAQSTAENSSSTAASAPSEAPAALPSGASASIWERLRALFDFS